MLRTSESYRAIIQLLWMRFGIRDEFTQALHWQLLANDDDVRHRHELRNGLQFFRIVVELLEEAAVRGERAYASDEQSVTVRRRAADGGSADVAARARHVVINDRLTERLLHLAEHDPRDHVARASSCVRYDNVD